VRAYQEGEDEERLGGDGGDGLEGCVEERRRILRVVASGGRFRGKFIVFDDINAHDSTPTHLPPLFMNDIATLRDCLFLLLKLQLLLSLPLSLCLPPRIKSSFESDPSIPHLPIPDPQP